MRTNIFTICRRTFITSLTCCQEPKKQILKQMIKMWHEDPSKLPGTWRDFFRLNPQFVGGKVDKSAIKQEAQADNSYELFLIDQIQVNRLVTVYQSSAHLTASIDPLNIKRAKFKRNDTRLTLKHKPSLHVLPLDKQKQIFISPTVFVGGTGHKVLTFQELIKRLNNAYNGSVGIEFMHNSSIDVAQWIRKKFEDPNLRNKINSPAIKRNILKKLIRTKLFQEFIQAKFPVVKKQSFVDGCEMLIPGLQYLLDSASATGAQIFILGMNTPRARLNILANVFRKPLSQIFVPFAKHGLPEDAKFKFGNYIKKVSTDQALPTEFSVVANTPDFPETAGPVVAGKTKAEQVMSEEENKVWPILIHGDEVIRGQGTLFETMRITRQPDYFTRGVIHILLTNFDYIPDVQTDERCCYYPSDVARTVMAPIFHVNTRDPEAVIYVMQVAAEYRIKFESDVFVDLICVKKDKATSKYQENLINALQPLADEYGEKLLAEKIVTRYDIVDEQQRYGHFLDFNLSKANRSHFEQNEWLDSPWKRFYEEKLQYKEPITGIMKSFFLHFFKKLLRYPLDIDIHPEIKQAEIEYRENVMSLEQLTFIEAEIAVFGSLLEEGFHVRLTGDEVETSSLFPRQYILRSMTESLSRSPIKAVFKDKANFTFTNTLSAEMGVIGFEIGYSHSNPNVIVLWQSHREDRTSIGQYLIDVFLAAGESRWLRQCGLTCILPHGMDGEGDDCSTARPERFLQMCNDDEFIPEFDMGVQLNQCNWIIANVTTPANYFHVIRRQAKLNFRKPLMLFMPKKKFTRSKISSLYEILGSTMFKTYIPDSERPDKEKVRKVLLCTGPVYSELDEERKVHDPNKQIVLGRLEQISPFPYKLVREHVSLYPNAKVYWVQEEHKNQGWWNYVRPRILSALKGLHSECSYIGRAHSVFRATNDYTIHLKEKETYLAEAMKL
ncbi:hypothetical protein O3M35_007518 [Rhynocoris fuscipes]|uniref:Transketolase-like pyrimidine-binding domain-containing protein n=1 Tax=Rhynocoris fuscipes TaxID=488301 RepID=A0AAW1DDC4_9HEMI